MQPEPDAQVQPRLDGGEEQHAREPQHAGAHDHTPQIQAGEPPAQRRIAQLPALAHAERRQPQQPDAQRDRHEHGDEHDDDRARPAQPALQMSGQRGRRRGGVDQRPRGELDQGHDRQPPRRPASAQPHLSAPSA